MKLNLFNNNEMKKLSLPDLAGRLFIGFFVVMLLLTVVSRAADSVLIPTVTVSSAKQGKLTYTVEGTGVIEENAMAFVKVPAGLTVTSVEAEIGQTLTPKDPIFTFDKTAIEDQISAKQDEKRLIEIAMGQAVLNSGTIQAGYQVDSAVLTQEQAQKNLEAAQKALEDAKIAIKEEKENALDIAKKNYEALLRDKESAIKASERSLILKQENLNALNQKKSDVEIVLMQYKDAVKRISEVDISAVTTQIMKNYYGSGYEAHQKQVDMAKVDLYRADEDYQLAKQNWDKKLEELKYLYPDHTDPMYIKAYNELTSAKDEQLKVLERISVDCGTALTELTKKDKEIVEALEVYKTQIQGNDENKEIEAYNKIFKILYPDDAGNQSVIQATVRDIEWMKEDIEELKELWDEKIEAAKEQVDKAQKDWDEIIAGTYNYDKSLSMHLNAIEVAKQQLTLAQLGLEQAKQSSGNINISKNYSMESYQIQLNNKQKEIEELEKLLESGGIMVTPVGGVLVNFNIEPGSVTTGYEKVAIATGECGFCAYVHKNFIEKLEIGDEIEVKIGSSTDAIKVELNSIGSEDENGMCEITGILPEGEYPIGSYVSYKITKKSEPFQTSIPLEALRQDMYGNTYILKVIYKNTIMGEEAVAFKVNVDVIEKDYQRCAISGAVSETDLIITGSSKSISDGDRVRVE